MRRRNDRWLAADRAVEHVHALFRKALQKIGRRSFAHPVDGERNRRLAGLSRNPFSELRSVDQHDIAADRLELGDDVVAPHDIDGFQTKRFRDRNQRPPDAGIGTVLDHPGSRRQSDKIGQQQIRGRRIDAQHRELMDVAIWQRPQTARIRLDPFRPGGRRIGHQRAVTLFQVLDAAPDGDDAADAFGSHHARQFWAIAIAARDHQKIAHIDRRGFERDDDLALGRRADVGDVDYLQDLGWIAERFNLDCLHVR